MARGSKRNNGGDVVLESRHLMGLFVLMVIIFGVVFVLGYELGRNQFGNQVRAADVQPSLPLKPGPLPSSGSAIVPGGQPPAGAKKPVTGGAAPLNAKAQPNSSTPASSTVSLNAKTPPASSSQPVVKNQPTTSAVQPVPGKSSTPAGKPAVTPTQPANSTSNAKTQPGGLNAPLIPTGAYLIQVAAMTKESDALEMAQALQMKKFPAFVLPPGADRFYHVQVGPYRDQKSAETAKKALEDEGFKTLIKH